jgi:hypothetical protein
MKYLFALISMFFLIIPLSAQENRILIIGKGLEVAEDEVVARLTADIENTPAAVLLMGDYLQNRHRINREFLISSPIGKALRAYNGEVYIVPGEREYGPHQINATEHLAILSESLAEIDSSWHLVPDKGCPGPIQVEINQSFVLVFINTSRYFHDGEVIELPECGLEDESTMFTELEDILELNPHRPVFVVGHHPLRSRGLHAGFFPWYQHLLPPVLGSLYVGFRKYIGGIQDMAANRYEELVERLKESLSGHDGIYYLSGHDGYFHYDIREEAIPRSQVIAGALGKPEYVRKVPEKKRPGAIQMSDYLRISDDPGYVLVDVLNVQPSLTYKVAVAYRTAAEDLVSVSFYNGAIPISLRTPRDTVFAGQTIDARATGKLAKESKAPGLLGNNYRAEWEAVIHDVPVIDLEEKLGGLDIVKKGGGQQTRSLRLEAENGKQYVLRSIEKFPEKAVPLNLKNTIAEDIIRDQISASHPYGAFVVPPMADAAGVYHTNPELVYLPDDPVLGEYREDFAEGLYLFEERPDDDHWEEAGFFGNAPEIMSTADVVEKMGNDDDHFIEEDQVIRSRLFDFWIGDWDRHDDQWRWKRTKDEDDIKHYEPIPRDRDQTFFWSDGRLLRIGSRRWGQPKFQGFRDV